MAYNNGFPINYQQMYPQYNYIPQQPIIQTQPVTNDNGIIWVRRGRSARTGRYVSRDSEKERMIGKLEDMMDSVSTERERRILQQCVDKLEQQ